MNNTIQKKHISFRDWCIENDAQYLLDEWDYENNDVTPDEVTSGCDLKINWIKHYDDPKSGKHFVFRWSASVGHRKSGEGCPYLSKPPHKIMPGFNDLATTNPELIKLWAKKENKEQLGLEITNVSKGTRVVAFWICEIHGIYEQPIADKASGEGCPFCSSKRVLKGFNDLESKFPDIAKEWDYQKNTTIPDKVSYGSPKQYWWVCPLGHEYKASVNQRTGHNKSGCPYCSNKKVLVGYNDLQTINPTIAELWDYEKNYPLKPIEITANSNRYVWWKCKNNHSFKARVWNRNNSTGCPYCNDLLIWPGFNDLATKHPALMKEWDFEKNNKLGVDPNKVAPSSKQKVYWNCPAGHSYRTSIVSRARMNTGCPECAIMYRISTAEKVIAYYFKEALEAEENAHPKFLNGRELDLYSSKYNVGIEYDGKYFHKNTKRDLKKDEDCQKNGVLLIRIREKGNSFYDSSSIKIQCEIRNNNYNSLKKPIEDVIKILNDRFKLSISQDIDIEKDLPTILNDIEITSKDYSVLSDPILSEEWDYEKNELKPDHVPLSYNHKVSWKCKKEGHSWEATVASRWQNKSGCPYCAHLLVDKKENSLGYLRPDLAKQWDYERNEKTPFDYLPRSNQSVYWICENGHHFKARINSRTKGKAKCSICLNQTIIDGVNDFVTLYPEIAEEWDYERNTVDPHKISGGSNKSFYWKCKKCGYSWKTSLASRTKRGSSCPICKNKKVVSGHNDLETLYPEIAKEWDYSKNPEKPSNVNPGSNKVFYFICPKGHPYEKRLYLRVQGSGCPYCSNHKVLKGFNDLATTNPELLSEWDYEKNSIKPTEVTFGTDKKVYWKCKNGHSWKTYLINRTRKKCGCPVCVKEAKKKKS